MKDFFEKAFEPTILIRIAIAGSICGKYFNSFIKLPNMLIFTIKVLSWKNKT